MRKIPFAGVELTSQRVRGLRGTSELPGRPACRGKIVKTFSRWDHRLQDKTSSWHLTGFPMVVTLGQQYMLISGRSPPLYCLYTSIANCNRHAGTPGAFRFFFKHQIKIKHKQCCLKENHNAPRPFEHPPVRGEKMSKRVPGRWDQRLQIQNLFMALNGFPDGNNIGSTV